MSYRISPKEDWVKTNIALVGCGGTGGFVAEGLCRLLGDSDDGLLLIDHDRVEPRNLKRQNFFEEDIGKFKSQALAERLARLYGRQIAYSVYPYDPEIIGKVWGGGMYSRAIQGLVIGCVDNPNARREISSGLEFGNWWLDAGNGYHSGQVLIGNKTDADALEGRAFYEPDRLAMNLPAPGLQLPSLLIPTGGVAAQELSCAEAVEADEQSPVINQAMATLVLNFVLKLRRRELTWMGAYLDLEAGTLTSVPAEPVTVARMLGVKIKSLMCEPVNCSRGMLMLPR